MRTELERRLERQWLQDRAGKKAAKTKRRQRVDWAKYSVFA